MHQKAIDNFLNKGYSCSESVVKAAIDEGLIDKEALNIATSFSGGMGSGCLCGAIAGAQIVIGYIFGKNKTNTARVLAKEFIEKFKETHKATCCRVLTAKFKDNFQSKERKLHCVNMVEFCSKLLAETIEKEKTKIN